MPLREVTWASFPSADVDSEVWVGLRACVSDKPPSNVDLQAYIDFILSNRELVFIEHLLCAR